MSDIRPAIAIVGIGGVFPGARDFEEFWANIVHGRSAARETPADRWALSMEDAFDARIGQPDKVYSTRACFVSHEPALNAAKLSLRADTIASLDPGTRPPTSL